MRLSIRSMLVTAFVVAGPFTAALAQANPSSDDILKSLRPGAGFSGGTRGIRPTMQAPEPALDRPQSTAPSAAMPAAHRPATVRPSQPAPAEASQAPSVNLNIPFASGSADLNPTATRTVNDLGRALANPALSGSRFPYRGPHRYRRRPGGEQGPVGPPGRHRGRLPGRTLPPRSQQA